MKTTSEPPPDELLPPDPQAASVVAASPPPTAPRKPRRDRNGAVAGEAASVVWSRLIASLLHESVGVSKLHDVSERKRFPYDLLKVHARYGRDPRQPFGQCLFWQ